jgi:hypothetical protein
MEESGRTEMMVDRERIHRAIDQLSADKLAKVSEYIEFLHFREDRGSEWAKDFYELLAPVREQVREAGMSEDEVNQLIDEAIEEVRHEQHA